MNYTEPSRNFTLFIWQVDQVIAFGHWPCHVLYVACLCQRIPIGCSFASAIAASLHFEAHVMPPRKRKRATTTASPSNDSAIRESKVSRQRLSHPGEGDGDDHDKQQVSCLPMCLHVKCVVQEAHVSLAKTPVSWLASSSLLQPRC